ncbi:MAG: hypothetical protein JXO22_10325 [Phycisphaerae bacterium]|nr:hypothetical protein [Phycisphaerae bacterium]
MLRRLKPWMIVIGVGLCMTTALGQAQDDEWSEEEEEQAPLQGPWLTDKMWDGLMGKMARDMSTRYELDDDQIHMTTELLQERVPTWFQDHRQDIQPLLNEYFEMLLNGEPPTPEQAAKWSQQVLPLMEDFNGVVSGVGDGMREYLTEDQQVVLDSEMAAFEVGMGFLGRRLETWSEGGYDAYTDWPESPGFHAAERERQQAISTEIREARGARMREITGGAIRAPQRSSDPWVKYVEDFIRKYGLNSEQEAQARNILRRYQEQRDAYLQRRDADIDAVEQKIIEAQKAGDSEAKDKWVAEYGRLSEPIETKFMILKEKLSKIPTRAQRATAAEHEGADKPPATSDSPAKPGTPE